MRRALAWANASVTFALLVVTLIVLPLLYPLQVTPTTTSITLDLYAGQDIGRRAAEIALALTFGSFSLLGIAILRRSPAQAMGWILMGIGSSFAFVLAVGSYAVFGLYGVPGGLPGADLAVWIGQWSWVPGWTLLAVFLLLFPSGTPASPRWWRAIWLVIAIAGIELVAYFLGPDPSTGDLPVHRPFTIPGADPLLFVVGRISDVLSAGTFMLAVGSLVVRYRSGDGIVRQQVKWLAYATALLSVGVVSVTLISAVWGPAFAYATTTLPLVLLLSTLPVCAAIAILRYRLYDVDILINRTVVYGSLTAVLAASYVTLVVLFQSVLRPLTGGSEIAVAGSTLATLALVQPLRRRFQEAVDRRFYRSRYDAARTLDAFAGRLRDEVDLDALRGEVLDVIGDTVRPAHAGVWLRGAR